MDVDFVCNRGVLFFSGSRGNWREPGRPISEFERGKSNGGLPDRVGFDRARVYRRSKSGESWDEEGNFLKHDNS